MKDANYHLRSLELCRSRELLGGVKALESTLWETSSNALSDLGWDADQVIFALEERQNKRKFA
jgi:hypothetical protein